MIFKDGLRKVGFFEDNVYKRPLKNMSDYDAFEKKTKHKKIKIPEAFH